MSKCAKCCGSCGSCGDGAMELNQGELSMLAKLGQIPFLPVSRKADDPAPVYLEDQECSTEEYSLILQCLEKKGLISVDFDAPLKGAQIRDPSYPIHGSIALTAKGQQVVEMMEIQGILD